MGLSAFLGHNVEKIEGVKFKVSDRFKDSEGNIVPFILTPIDSKEDEKIKAECSVQELDHKSGKVNMSFDNIGYVRKMTIATIKEPNLHSQELQDSYGVMNPEDLIVKMLLPGEYTNLQKKVQQVNGFKPFGELEEDAKNE